VVVPGNCGDGNGIRRSTTSGQCQGGNLTKNIYLKFAIIFWIARDSAKIYHFNHFSLLNATNTLLGKSSLYFI
jgi:hypothetical protein